MDLTRKCIDSIHKHTRKPFKISVADNASTDGTREYLQEIFRMGKINKLVLLDRNYGIAAASNTLWELSEADYFVKLDNDIELINSNWTDSFIKILNQKSDFKIGAVSYNFYRNSPDAPTIDIVDAGNIKFELPRNTAEIYGGCVFIKKNIHSELGYWSEDFGRYGWEDTDYGIRLMLSGYNCAFALENNLMVHHGETEDVKDADYMAFKKKKFKDLSKMMAANFFMYLLSIKSKKAERRYRLSPEYSSDRANYSLEINPANRESEDIKEFRRFLRDIGMEISFPRNMKDSQELFEKFKIVKKIWMNR